LLSSSWPSSTAPHRGSLRAAAFECRNEVDFPLRERGTTDAVGDGNYEEMLGAIAEFFHTGRAPFDVAETIEIFEFMTAADVSKERKGAAVPLAEVRK
jgi:hypothetical protein